MHKSLSLMAAALASAAVLATACSPGHSKSSSAASAPHAGIITRVQCGVQFASWEKKYQFSSLLKQLALDIRTMPMGTAPGDKTALQQMTASLQTDVVFFQAHMPPACIPGFDTQLGAAFAQVLNANAAAHSSNPAQYQLASGDLHAAGRFLQAASQDATRYTAGKTAAARTGHPVAAHLAAARTAASRPRDPFPRQFFILWGTGEPRTSFTPPYTAENCQSRFYPPTGKWYLACFPQLYVYVYPSPSGLLPVLQQIMQQSS